MALTIDLPPDVERSLRADIPDLEADAKEAYAVDLYRRGNLSKTQLTEVLGVDRLEAEGVLKRHAIFDGSISESDIDSDRQTLERLFQGPR